MEVIQHDDEWRILGRLAKEGLLLRPVGLAPFSFPPSAGGVQLLPSPLQIQLCSQKT